MLECCLCWKKSDNVDDVTNICDDCKELFLDLYEQAFDSLPEGYQPCDFSYHPEFCKECFWDNEPYCAYKVMCALKNKQQQGN